MPWLICVLAVLQATGSPAASKSWAAAGQTTLAPEKPQEDVVVIGRRGAADVAPETALDAAEIDALSAYDIREVIRRTKESLGFDAEPVVIVNGRRVADPSAFLGFPPDALTRVEVLPREAGARYGGDPSRRVLNIVLQKRFSSRDGALDAKGPTAGGTSGVVGDLRRGTISGNNTNQLGGRVSHDTALLAGERPAYSRDHSGSDAVSLRPAAESVSANLALTRALGDWSASVNVQAQARDDRSTTLGSDAPIDSRRTARGLSVIGGLSGELAGWSLQGTLIGQLSTTGQSGLLSSQSSQQTVSATLSANRRLLDLPAGPIVVNLTTQASRSRSTTETAGMRPVFHARTIDLTGTAAIPLWHAPVERGSVAARLAGDMSMTLGANVRRSDAGRGKGLNAGLAWTVLRKLRLNGAWSSSTDSLSDVQRFQPPYYGLPTTVFDFVAGEAADVLPILGGSPDLRPPRFDRMSLSAALGPFSARKIFGGLSLYRSNATDSIGALPTVTPELEAAFPGRFQRNADGRLIAIDQRPINFSSARTEALTSSLSATFPLGSTMAGASGGVLRVAVNHTLQLRNITTIQSGLPEMNLLAGDGGGLPKQQLDIQVDARRGRWGVNLATRWRNGYRVRRDSGRDGPDDLLVDSIGAIDLRLSYLTRGVLPASKNGAAARRSGGIQLGFEVDNVLDERPGATLGDGGPAPGYGRDDRDPIGRTVRATVRSRF